MMCEVYNSSDVALDALSPLGRLTLVGYSVPPDICKHYDKLTCGEFQECVAYLNSQYCTVRNAKNVSGNHAHLGTNIGGRVYLLYFDECMKETRDKALSHSAYPELNDEICRTSSEVFKPMSKSCRISASSGLSLASERSYSPVPDGTNLRFKKHSAFEATEEAAAAIAT